MSIHVKAQRLKIASAFFFGCAANAQIWTTVFFEAEK